MRCWSVKNVKLYVENNPKFGISHISCVDSEDLASTDQPNMLVFSVAEVDKRRMDKDPESGEATVHEFFYINNKTNVEVIVISSEYGGKCLSSDPSNPEKNLLINMPKFLTGGSRLKYKPVEITFNVPKDRTSLITHINCRDETGNIFPFSVADIKHMAKYPGDNYFYKVSPESTMGEKEIVFDQSAWDDKSSPTMKFLLTLKEKLPEDIPE